MSYKCGRPDCKGCYPRPESIVEEFRRLHEAGELPPLHVFDGWYFPEPEPSAPVVKAHTCTVNTFPDCCYPDTPPVELAECTIPECTLETERVGQPCDPCMSELGAGA